MTKYYTHTCKYIQTFKVECILIYLNTDTQKHTHAYIPIYIHTHTHTYIDINIYKHRLTCIYTHTHIQKHTNIITITHIHIYRYFLYHINYLTQIFVCTSAFVYTSIQLQFLSYICIQRFMGAIIAVYDKLIIYQKA